VPQTNSITEVLQEWRAGNRGAAERLFPLVYDELKRSARRALRGERAEHTLQPTDLVNEVCVKMLGQAQVSWQDRAHFLAVAANQMRCVLVDYARARGTVKRGGGIRRVEIQASLEPSTAPPAIDVVALSDALDALTEVDPQQARIVELRFFAGLTSAETAEALGISRATVDRDWAMARAWLRHTLR
jgi:RNA polymerase sigma factor (TIGR02999 family)